MTYRSNNRLLLSEKPLTSDPEVFPDMNDVYASIHLLNDWVTQVQENLTSGEDIVDPDKAIPFKTWFWGTAGEPNPQGTIVSAVRGGRYWDENRNRIDLIDGWYKGCGGAQSNLYDKFLPAASNSNGMYGVLLDEAKSAGDIVRIGIGPAVIKVEGVFIGEILYCFPTFRIGAGGPNVGGGQAFSGQFQENRGGITTKAYNDTLPIGHIIANDYALLDFRVDGFTYQLNSFVPPNPETGGGGA